jgi:hypothetical protein
MAFISSSTLSGLEFKDASPNLRNNSFMRSSYSGGALGGFGATGSCSITAMSPNTKGFEGPYQSSQGSATAASPDAATAGTPYWYGVYNLGPRMGRGGLANGWGGLGDGNILRMTAPANTSRNYYDGCTIGLPYPIKRNYLRFRGWVWIQSGTMNTFWISIIDAGQAITIPNYNTWTYVDQLCGMSQVTDADCRINFLYSSDTRAVEMYFAMINITIPEGTGDLSQHPGSATNG